MLTYIQASRIRQIHMYTFSVAEIMLHFEKVLKKTRENFVVIQNDFDEFF